MFTLPSFEECEKNKARLISQWLKTANLSIKEITEQVLTLRKQCERLLIYHSLVIPPDAETNENFKTILRRGYLLSNRALESSQIARTSRIRQPDKNLGLNDYVYFTFGHPPTPALGSQNLILAVSFAVFSSKAHYPEYWASWGDIASIAEEICPKLSWSSLAEEEYLHVFQEYRTRIFPVSDLPELVAYFLVANRKDEHLSPRELRKAWCDSRGNHGPEIKVKERFSLRNFAYCFVNNHNSLAGKIASFLYANQLIKCSPTTNQSC